MSDEKYRIKGWHAQALRAAASYMEAKARLAEFRDALEALGLNVEAHDFQTNLNEGKAYRCATDGCPVVCFGLPWGNDLEPLRCELHQKIHDERVLVKRDEDLEKGLVS
jgi:hypothetical protein